MSAQPGPQSLPLMGGGGGGKVEGVCNHCTLRLVLAASLAASLAEGLCQQ